MSLVTNYTGFHLEDVLTNGILREKLSNHETNLIPVRIRNSITRKRIALVWHLGLRKDKDEIFMGIWRGLRKRFSKYDGSFNHEKGFRVEMMSMNTFKGKSIRDTILHFCPEYGKSPVNVGSAEIIQLVVPKPRNSTS